MTLDEKIDALTGKVDNFTRGLARLMQHLGAMQPAGSAAQSTAGRVATDAEIDDPEWGDKEIRKDPPKWKGAAFKGQRWSACPPEYLDALASFLDWCATDKRTKSAAMPDGDEKSNAIKYASYDEMDAAKVRAWAKRNREAGGL